MDLINLAMARCEDDDNNERVGGRMYPVIDWLLTVCGTRHGSGCIRMALRTLTGSNLAPCWPAGCSPGPDVAPHIRR